MLNLMSMAINIGLPNPKDPFDILYNPATNYVADLEGLYLGEMGYVFRSVVIWIGLIAISATLISLFFVHKSDLVQEKKRYIERILWSLFWVASAVTVFDVVKAFFDSIFFKGG